jgi:hypothetical protein
MARPTQKQIAAKVAEYRERDRQQAIADARLKTDVAIGSDPDTKALVEGITAHKTAKRVVPDTGIPPRLAGWGDSDHAGVNARIDAQLRDIRLAHWRAGRDQHATEETVIAPEPVSVPVTAEHPRAGLLRMHCDGDGWTVRIRGVDYGCGDVKAGERDFDDDGAPTFTPRGSVVEAAARAALNAPGGPETPVGTIVFVGNPDGGDPIERIVGQQQQYDPDADGLISSFRAKLATWKGQHRD